MTFMDRTSEFNSVAENVRSKQAHAKPMKRTPMQQKSQFTVTAAKIGKDISDTSDKITKLTKLIKKVTPFDDHKLEIEELTSMVKQSIQSLNRDLVSLRDCSKSGSASKQNSAHSDTIVTFLNTKLASTTKCFKDALELQTENIKEKSKIDVFIGSNKNNKALTPIKTSTLSKYSNLPDSPQNSGGEVVLHMPGVSQSHSQQVFLQEDYTSTRATAVENIERTIAELGGIFQQLAHLVAEQGDMLQRIDQDIDNSQMHVDRAQNELLKVLYNVSSSRMLIVKLFFVLIFFAVIFIVFFV